MEDEPVLRAGYRLDRYELLCPIASGGMAAVWLARLRGKRGFEKLFAIKTIKTELTADSRFQEMFLDEARIASGIEHPNVAQILDLGEFEDILYIVMEWVDGESLAKIAKLSIKRKKPIPVGLSLRLMADACAGLHAAHELSDMKGDSLGVVHRDVSPHNILVTNNGSAKVIDFGVAKASNRKASETGEGIVKGKIRFMAPEQVRGRDVDRRADLWAIGATLHELVTGRLPFNDDSDVDIVRRLLSDEPPTIAEDLPDPILRILDHSLVRDPNARFATAASMRRAIEVAIDLIGEPSSSDDVAEFLRENFSDLAKKRRETVSHAVSAADTRQTESDSPRLNRPSEDVAFAPTMVSLRQGPEDEHPVPLRKRSDPKQRVSAVDVVEGKELAKANAGAEEDSKLTSAATYLNAGAPQRSRGRGIFWVLTPLALVEVAWFVWPGGARIRTEALRFTASEPVAPPAVVVPSSVPNVDALPDASVSVEVTPFALGSGSVTAPSPLARPLDGGRRRHHLGTVETPAGSASSPVAAPTDEPPNDDPY